MSGPINHDALCRGITARNPNMLVPWFLMASYVYYHLDEAMITDGLYDEMAKGLIQRWDEIEHWHKHLIDRAALEAGSLFALRREDYPMRVVYGAQHLLMGLHPAARRRRSQHVQPAAKPTLPPARVRVRVRA